MRKLLIVFLGIAITILMSSWGFYAHKMINRAAVFTLPAAIAFFYKKNIDYISIHAVDPDKRRYADPEEGNRHFIDLDRYGDTPLATIPRRWADAVLKYSEDTLKENGTVPWEIYLSYWKLVNAFKIGSFHQVLRHSTTLGHYIADAHTPLHTTQNYDGKLTGQEGIHSFWESRLPELFAKDYSFFVGKAHYIENPLDQAWKIVGHTYSLVDSVLAIEAELSKRFPPNQKYVYESRNKLLNRTYSREYSNAYHSDLHGMVEKQMRSSIIMIGSFWYTAWIDAGQPDLKQFSNTVVATDSLDAPKEPKPGQKPLGRKY